MGRSSRWRLRTTMFICSSCREFRWGRVGGRRDETSRDFKGRLVLGRRGRERLGNYPSRRVSISGHVVSEGPLTPALSRRERGEYVCL